jgi:hypothetical protein
MTLKAAPASIRQDDFDDSLWSGLNHLVGVGCLVKGNSLAHQVVSF